MTLIAVPPFAWCQAESPIAVANGTTVDANGESYGFVFSAPKTGTIDRVGFRTGLVTTGDTGMVVSLETLDASMNPSGTLWGTNTSAVQTLLATDDNLWIETTLTAGASVVRGDILAMQLRAPAAGSTIVGVINGMNGTASETAFPYIDAFLGGVWTKGGSKMPVGSLRYSDGTYPAIPGLLPVASGTGSFGTTSYQAATSPDERGNKLTVPFACKVSGIWQKATATTAGDFEVRLYNSSSTLLASKAVDGDTNPQIAGAVWHTLNTEVTLAAGDVVRVTKLATAATNTTLYDLTVPSGLSSMIPMGSATQFTTRADLGAWTDVSDRFASIGLVISALDDGASSGSSARAYSYTT